MIREVVRVTALGIVVVVATCVVLTAAPRWGRLTVTPIVITPPLEYIPTDEGAVRPPQWHFAATAAARLADVLEDAGLTANQIQQLRATAEPDPSGGVVLAPDPALVRGLASDVRARLYAELAKHPLNFDQLSAFRFHGASVDDWLGPDVAPEARKLIEPLVYRDGDFLFLADLESVRAQIGNGPPLQHLIKRLLAQATVQVTLDVDDPSQVDSLAEYLGARRAQGRHPSRARVRGRQQLQPLGRHHLSSARPRAPAALSLPEDQPRRAREVAARQLLLDRAQLLQRRPGRPAARSEVRARAAAAGLLPRA